MPLTRAEACHEGLLRRGIACKYADVFRGKARTDAQTLRLELLQKRRASAFMERGELRIKIKHRSAHALKSRTAAFVVIAEICKMAF